MKPSAVSAAAPPGIVAIPIRLVESSAARWLALVCVGQVLLWSVAFGLTYRAPEIDSAEQFVWAFSLESGYWKHPPLPSWIMHALLQVFGPSVVLPFVATQCCAVLAMVLVWRLGCAWMSPSRALVAVALTSLISYHSVGADNFNHSTALLPFQAATLLAFHRAMRRSSLALWMLSGLLAGLSVLVKYVALLPVLGLVVYFACDRALHTRRQLVGLAIAVATFTVVLVPHVVWLGSTNYLPFHYARSVAQAMPGLGATFEQLGDFLGIQLVRALPFLGAALYLTWPRRAQSVVSAPGGWGPRPAPDARGGNDRLFLWIVGLAPLLGTVAIALLTQTALQSRWGSNAFLLAGLMLMTKLRQPESGLMVRRALHAAAVVQVVLCLGMTLSKTVVAERLGVATRANFPGDVLADKAHAAWRAHAGDAPLRIVISDIWLGGNIVANSTERVAVLIDGHRFKAPWVKAGAVKACGALVLDDLTEDGGAHAVPNPTLESFLERADVTGEWSLPWSRPELHESDGDRGRIRWGVILPTPGANCDLR